MGCVTPFIQPCERRHDLRLPGAADGAQRDSTRSSTSARASAVPESPRATVTFAFPAHDVRAFFDASRARSASAVARQLPPYRIRTATRRTLTRRRRPPSGDIRAIHARVSYLLPRLLRSGGTAHGRSTRHLAGAGIVRRAARLGPASPGGKALPTPADTWRPRRWRAR